MRYNRSSHMSSVARFGLAAAVTMTTIHTAAARDLEVVTSIKPVHSIVASVMSGVGTPKLLVRGASSPHDFSLRPSDARTLQQADLVFWVGDGLETFLVKPIAALGTKAKVVELAEAGGMTLLPFREGGPWESHDHAGGKGHEHGHGHSHGHSHGGGKAGKATAAKTSHDGGHDLHVWLDPQNAKAMTLAIVAALAAKDPANAATFTRNGEALVKRLGEAEAKLAARLAPIKERPFVVFHDAYQYMERRFGLNAVGSITVSPERQPSPKRLQALRKRIQELGAVCVFSEPQFQPKLVTSVIEGTRAKTAVLDPLGAGLAEGPELLFELFDLNAQALTTCLAPTA